ncbi:carbohydrate kinase [Defluviimonas sp. WL0002]|uniref:Carbohydrate kinase n=1 Tax=Albidovulum marisflavi TaxID=2984159 RepID=A0ABT2ZAH2_9RHOB|nr:carbohydrate kinase [Defluviimonas sp. WL0002]MCV2868083.1 carbohydrate kinase [Defluviimonas sp. WL0002]
MILCCGEALIDMLPRESREGERAFAPHPGGAVFNTAIALGRLGTPAGFFAGLSTDLFGDMLSDALSLSNVGFDLCPRSGQPTTLAFVQLHDGQASYAFYDEATAGRMLSPQSLPEIPSGVSTLFFGGISLVSEPCGSAYEALMLREAPARVTMIDPNIRPGFIMDQGLYRARIERMLAAADIVKVSDEDLRWIFGPGDIASLAGRLLSLGPKVVFVTEGAMGAHAFTTRDTRFRPARRVAVADTVGAGDTFNAGVLAALHEAGALSRDRLAAPEPALLDAALDLGIAAAAVTVSRAGANPPWRKEID